MARSPIRATMVAIASVTARSSALVVLPATNDLSIFTTWTGSERNVVRDEYPVPKSSIAICDTEGGQGPRAGWIA